MGATVVAGRQCTVDREPLPLRTAHHACQRLVTTRPHSHSNTLSRNRRFQNLGMPLKGTGFFCFSPCHCVAIHLMEKTRNV